MQDSRGPGTNSTMRRAAVPHARPQHLQLLRRNAAVIQGAFATFWAVRWALLVGVWEVPIAVAIIALVLGRRAFRSTSPLRARDVFRTAEGRAFLRPVWVMSIVQIAASVVLPALGPMLGRPDLSLAIVALTITVFFWFFAGPLELGAVRWLASMTTGIVVVLALSSRGDALNRAVCGVMAFSLLASARSCSVNSAAPESLPRMSRLGQ